MALRINTNISALNAHKNMIDNDNKLSNSLNRLSTGLRINKAADDSSGMIIADSLKAQHMGIGQAIRNANDGISIVQTADGALQESINIINTIKTKAIQAASDGQTTKTRTAIQNDIDKLMAELDVIAKTTSFNGQKLLSGSFTNKSIQIGAFSRETASVSIGSTESTKMGHITTSNLSLAGNGGEVQLTITSALTGEQLTLNNIDIQSNNNAENGMGALADEVNRYTSATGIKATAIIKTTTSAAIAAGTTGSDFAINGVTIGAITATANDSNGALVTAINGKTAEHGITAAMEENGALTLTSSDGRSIAVTGSVSSVFNSTANDMSTLGYLFLSQSGVTQFEINGIGAGASGADIILTDSAGSNQLVTTAASILASGSTVGAGSRFSAGTIIGGDALLESFTTNTASDYKLKTGSSIYWGSDISQGTTLGGSVVVGGSTSGSTVTAIDMLVSSGSTLESGSVLGKDTVVSTAFNTGSGGHTYAVGDTLSDAITLGSDLTLGADMTLMYNSTSNQSSVIQSGSILAAGSTVGMDINDIGINYTTTAVTGYMSTEAAGATGTATTANMFVESAIATSTGDVTIKAGSLLASGTVLSIYSGGTGTTTWSGPTLVTTTGTLEAGDSISISATGAATSTLGGFSITLSGDQVVSEDIVTFGSNVTDGGGANGTTTIITSGSVLTTGFIVSNMATGLGGTSGTSRTVTLTESDVTEDMTLKIGSELQTGSKVMAGSTLGDDTYLMGGTLSVSTSSFTTYQRTELATNSMLVSMNTSSNATTIAEGSTIGGKLTVNNDTTISSDMMLTTGTLLKQGTMFKAGTVINQDMTLNSSTSGDTATETEITAGTELTSDLYVDADTTLSESIKLLKDSVIEQDSEIAVNTTNSGTVGLSDTANYKLSDLSVLTQEGAQRAIDIAEAALEALDNTRAGLGSVQNQFVSTISNLSVTKTNIQASESAIRDVDFAEESMNFARLQLLAQTGSYALAQANASSQTIMSLLQ
jgi:flagellin